MLERLQRWIDRVGFVALASGVFVLGMVHGLQVARLQLQLVVVALVVVWLQAAASSLLFTGGTLLAGAMFLWRLGLARPTAAPTDERVTAIVPVHRDAGVLDVSVGSLLASTQPVEVVVVTEPDDDACRERADGLAAFENVRHLVNTRYPGSKAGAINHALEETTGEYVAVFDADESVDPDFLARAVALLDEHDIVQGRAVPRVEGTVEALAYAESVLLSYVAQRFLYLLTGFRVAASRTVVCRRDAIESVGGYDTAMLTEDFDFAYRCYRAGLDIHEEVAHPSTIEAAHAPRDWWGQRKRWMTGYAQVLHRLVGEALPPRSRRDVLSVGICASAVLGSLMMLSLSAKLVALVLVGAEVMVLPPVATAVVVTGAVRLHDRLAGTVDRLGWRWLLVPLVFPLYSLVAMKAILEYTVSWDGEWYSVEKRGA